MMPSHLRRRLGQKKPTEQWKPSQPKKRYILPQYAMLCDHLDFEKGVDRSVIFREDGGPIAETEEEIEVEAYTLAAGVSNAPPQELKDHFRGYIGYSNKSLEQWWARKGLPISFGTFEATDKSQTEWCCAVHEGLKSLKIPFQPVDDGKLVMLIRPIPFSDQWEPFNAFVVS